MGRTQATPSRFRSLVIAFAVAALSVSAAAYATDRLVMAFPTPATETNRIWADSWANLGQFQPMSDTLVDQDPVTGELVPGLAVSWDRLDHDREWVFHLRRGVQFHHGYGEMTARDILHTYELLSRDDSRVNQVAVWREEIVDVQIIDDYTVAFYFRAPMTWGEQLFAIAGGEFYVQSKAQWDEGQEAAVDRQFVGTGPYQFVRREDGVSLLIEKFDDHWRDEEPQFREVLFRWVDEDTTALAMLLSDEAHVIQVSRDVAASAVGRGMRVISSTQESMQRYLRLGGQHYALPEYLDESSPLTNRNVRHALSLAIDLDEIHEEIYGGRVTPNHLTGWHASRPHWNPEWEEMFDEYHGYDPDRARELLAEAGYAPGDIELTLWLHAPPAQPEARIVLEALPGYWEAIGVRATLLPIDFGTVLSRWRQRDDINVVFATRNFPIRPTEQYIMESISAEGSPLSHYLVPEIEALRHELVATLDTDERNRLAREIGDVAFHGIYNIPLGNTFHEVVVNPDVISDWTFPGMNSYGASHYFTIERAGE